MQLMSLTLQILKCLLGFNTYRSPKVRREKRNLFGWANLDARVIIKSFNALAHFPVKAYSE